MIKPNINARSAKAPNYSTLVVVFPNSVTTENTTAVEFCSFREIALNYNHIHIHIVAVHFFFGCCVDFNAVILGIDEDTERIFIILV